MGFRESGGMLCLRLLKRLLDEGFTISREEASKYGECFQLLSMSGEVLEYKERFKVLPDGCLVLLKKVVESGIGLEAVFKSVSWRGFERIIAEVFRLRDHAVSEHYRFRFKKAVREIDVLVETPMILISIDCKQWVRRNYNIRLACRLQAERSRLLSEYLRKEKSLEKDVYPVVVTFLDSDVSLVNDCLVLPVWRILELAENPEVLSIIGKPVS
ncbi:MAG: hypothetical protein QXP45_04520 [Thermoproteota archaeon]